MLCVIATTGGELEEQQVKKQVTLKAMQWQKLLLTFKILEHFLAIFFLAQKTNSENSNQLVKYYIEE